MWGEAGSHASLESQKKQPHLVDELENPLLKDKVAPIKWSQYHLMYGWDHYFENVLDPAHVVVAHHGISGEWKSIPWARRPITWLGIDSCCFN